MFLYDTTISHIPATRDVILLLLLTVVQVLRFIPGLGWLEHLLASLLPQVTAPAAVTVMTAAVTIMAAAGLMPSDYC